MKSYKVQQRVKIIQAYYENGRSVRNTFRKIRDFVVSIIDLLSNVAKKFEESGSVQE